MFILEKEVTSETDPCRSLGGLFKEAEEELSAFLSAVTKTHGPECVTTAAKHWIQALEKAYLPNAPSKECFRKVTFAAVASLYH